MTDYIIMDIETASADEEPSQEIKLSLLDKRLTDPAKIAKAMTELPEKFPLKWFTGQITAIGFLTVSNSIENTVIFYQENGRFDEKTIIDFAWKYLAEQMANPKILVGYRSKDFDVPFFQGRSAILGSTPTCRLDRRKYLTDRHIDLYEYLGEHSLEFWERVFGITTRIHPEIKGEHCPALFIQGQYKQIAEHLTDDLHGEHALFKRLYPFIFFQNYNG